MFGSSDDTIAGDFVGWTAIDDIYYHIDTPKREAGVSSGGAGYYSGDITIPSTVKYEGVVCNVTGIENHAFATCTSLISVTIPNSVTSIGACAFLNCSGLTSVTIGNSVTIIDDYVFESCTSLKSITIPNSVTNIGNRAFNGCI